jgi:hypothetical protein
MARLDHPLARFSPRFSGTGRKIVGRQSIADAQDRQGALSAKDCRPTFGFRYAESENALVDCPNLSALLKTTAARLRWCGAWKLFRIGSWCSAVLMALAGAVHLGLRPLPLSATFAISLLPVLIPPVFFMCFSRSDYRKAAKRLDETFDGKNLFITSLDLVLQDSVDRSRMRFYVLEQAELSAASWKQYPERLPRLEAWSNAWIPLGLGLGGFFVLFSGGADRTFPVAADGKTPLEQVGQFTPEKPISFSENPDTHSKVSQFVAASSLREETERNPRLAQPPKSHTSETPIRNAASAKNSGQETGGRQSIRSMPSPDRSGGQSTTSDHVSPDDRAAQKTSAAGEGSDFSRTYGRSTEQAELTLRWTDLERGKGEHASNRRRALKHSSVTRPASGELAPPSGASRHGESQAFVPLSPAMRRYSDRYFQFLTKHSD